MFVTIEDHFLTYSDIIDSLLYHYIFCYIEELQKYRRFKISNFKYFVPLVKMMKTVETCIHDDENVWKQIIFILKPQFAP